MQRFLADEQAKMTEAEVARVNEYVAEYRDRLYDLSWFMRTLNEYIARQANLEDGVRGRFWEGRFKSQALLDEKALLAAMAYVDLNPVRAAMATTPEDSDYTSIQERLNRSPTPVAEPASALSQAGSDADKALKDKREFGVLQELQLLPRAPLLPFDATAQTTWAVPFAFDDYLELVDWTGRAIRDDKQGHIDGNQPAILKRMDIDGDAFIELSTRQMHKFGTAIGAPDALVEFCCKRQLKFLRGITVSRRLFDKKAA